jgi:hypothetical protein
MSKLIYLVNRLESNFQNFESENSLVSKSTVGWQIDHSLRVINGIINQLKKSNSIDYKWKFNFPRLVVFTLNKIPRGKANAPKTVQSYEKIAIQDLINQIEIAKKLIMELNSLNKNLNFKHPFFGILNTKQSIKFLEIHTNHHLKIIIDILK